MSEIEPRDGNESLPDPAFTPKDKRDLAKLELEIRSHGIELAKAIVTIRQRQLWKLHVNDDGVRTYPTFDAYMEQVYGHARQWVSQQTAWLEAIDLCAKLRKKGIKVPDVSCHAAKALPDSDEEAEAVLKEAAEENKISFSHENLKAIVERRHHYFKSNWQRPKAPTYEEFLKDLAIVAMLPKDRRRESSIRAAGYENTYESGDVDDDAIVDSDDDNVRAGVVNTNVDAPKPDFNASLKACCIQYQNLPEDTYLLHHRTGDELKATVDMLLPLAGEFEKLTKQEAEYRSAKEKRRVIRESLGIKPKKGKKKAEAPEQPADIPEDDADDTQNDADDTQNDADDTQPNDGIYVVATSGNFPKFAFGWGTTGEPTMEEMRRFWEDCAKVEVTSPSTITVTPKTPEEDICYRRRHQIPRIPHRQLCRRRRVEGC